MLKVMLCILTPKIGSASNLGFDGSIDISKPSELCFRSIGVELLGWWLCTVTSELRKLIPNKQLFLSNGKREKSKPHETVTLQSVLDPSNEVWAEVKGV